MSSKLRRAASAESTRLLMMANSLDTSAQNLISQAKRMRDAASRLIEAANEDRREEVAPSTPKDLSPGLMPRRPRRPRRVNGGPCTCSACERKREGWGRFKVSVRSTHGSTRYTVERAEDGTWSCTCPAWKYGRARLFKGQCKHILKVRDWLIDRTLNKDPDGVVAGIRYISGIYPRTAE